MAKILRGIDKVETTAGTVVDLDNISASGGSVSNTDVGIARSENSTQLVYEFGAETILAADGHSPSATSMMILGGYSTEYTNACEIKTFASNATGADHGDLFVEAGESAAGSDGSQLINAGGYTNASSFLNSFQLKQFSTTSTAVDYGDLIQARYAPAPASDGTQVMFAGGYNGSRVNTCDMKQFSSAANAVDHGDLSYAVQMPVGGSDGTLALFACGYDGASNLSSSDLKLFASDDLGVSHATLSTRRYAAGGSDASKMLVACGFNNVDLNIIESIQFSTSANSVSHGTSTENKYGMACSSDGTQLLIAGGGGSGGNIITCETTQFSNTSNAISHGILDLARRYPAGASGTA